ncbi:hypothetical protein ACA910_010206 [Epithemia clementina (nom. ined.)]
METTQDNIKSDQEVAFRLHQLETAFADNVWQQHYCLQKETEVAALQTTIKELEAHFVQLRQWVTWVEQQLAMGASVQYVQQELRKIEPILSEAQAFFVQRGGLEALRNWIPQLTTLVQPLSPQEKMDWSEQHSETCKLLHWLMADQADLETNVKDLAAQADRQAAKVEGVSYPSLSLLCT